MKAVVTVLLAVACFSAGPAEPARAAGADAAIPAVAGPAVPATKVASEESEAERVAREIARTAMWITRAASLVPPSRNAHATDLLVSAQELQLSARDAYEVQQFARAQRLTQAAREYAERAIRLAGPATADPEYVETVLDRTDDALDRLKDYLKEGGTVTAKRRYDQLKRDQKKARQRLHDGEVRGAYVATTRVRDGVLAVLRAAPPGGVPCPSAETAVKSAESTREKAREDIGPHPNGEAARCLAAADQHLAKARALLARHSCRDAVLRAKAAERQLENAIDASRPARGKEQ